MKCEPDRWESNYSQYHPCIHHTGLILREWLPWLALGRTDTERAYINSRSHMRSYKASFIMSLDDLISDNLFEIINSQEKHLTHWGWATHIWTMPPLVHIMACRLFGTKPLSEPMLMNYQLNPQETKFSEILIIIPTFSLKKMHFKMLCVKWWPFCPSLNELTLKSAVSANVQAPLDICKYSDDHILVLYMYRTVKTQ